MITKPIILITFERLLNILRYSVLNLSSISYILISECHRCYKNNTLNLIMNEFYHRENINDRPKIISTSSVLLTEVRPKMYDKLQMRLNSLKTSLDSSIYILKNEFKDMTKDKIKIITYKLTNKKQIRNFWREIKVSTKTKRIKSIILHLEEIHIELGLFSVQSYLTELINQCNYEFHQIGFFEHDNILLNNKEDLFKYYERTIKLFKMIETKLNKERDLNTELLSNKYSHLISILNETKDNDRLNGIIVVNTKNIIPQLCKLIEQYSPWLKPIDIHNFDFNNMESTFNSIFITTRLLYDDIKIKNCDLIIDFDSLRTIDEFAISLSKLSSVGSIYSFTCNKQNRMRIIKYTNDYIEKIPQLDLSYIKDYTAPCTTIYKNQYGAVLSKISSVGIMYQYFYRFPAIQNSIDSLFQYINTDEGVICQINFPFTSIIRTIKSDPCKNKKEAKKSACFKTIIELYGYKLIDKHFRPEVYVDERFIIEHDFDKKNKRTYEIYLPYELYSDYIITNDNQYIGYLYEIQIPFEGDYICDSSVYECFYGLILPNKLKDDYEFELDTTSGNLPIKVKFIQQVTLDQSQFNLIYLYHKWEVIQIDPTLGKKQNINTSLNKKYFLCLLTPNKEIHFDLMNLLSNLNENVDKLTPLETVENTLSTSLHNKYLYNKDEIFPGEFINTKKKAKRTHIIVNYRVNPVYMFRYQKKKFIFTKLSTEDISNFYIHPLPGHIIDNFIYIPRIMNLIEIYSRSQHLIDEIGVDLSYKIANECLTSHSTQISFSYEKLEFIGDSYFKFLVCRYLSFKYPYMMNVDFEILSEYLIKNSFMFHYAKNFSLGRYINIDKWRSEHWYPTGFDEGQNKTQKISDKMISDIFEALVGAYWIYGGRESAKMFLLNSGLSLLFEAKLNPFTGPESLPPQHLNLENIEKKVGYTFKAKQYLIDAFTYPFSKSEFSKYTNERTYILGNSILELFVTYHYLHKKFEHHTPGVSTIMRAAAVNSSVRSYCCVKKGLHHYIIHNFPNYRKQIKHYEKYINETKLSLPEIISLDVPFYLNEVIPSLLGAIYLDSNEDLDVVYMVFENIYLDFLREHINEHLKLPVVPSQKIFEEISLKCKCTRARSESFSLKLSGSIGTKIIHKDKVLGVAFSHIERASKNLASLNALKNIENIDVICEECLLNDKVNSLSLK